ncbi:3D-(3,5/4)-trihydroxycyclohexane-1,2-dione acylhydrolase (decyclizing) [Anoxynatronum buryatiense]|uniref:3D-(3,5/4)-trihydroxycyclohexane-1,2-dione hydrolase n=1 Tax=Anoxynatronum buryatiense TaxID=489973 RepID=A0AA46AHB7_9CLOT|nr:3D-(3,5/4)-trihydroxycyclohexane-1,2-dione acylhydrolase (decyclizing) [Anoxynatronum buryatiense]SMP38533.1 3D-(3,5/4)-trihydroxycyclohexane-1,2-dione hydrolase [Anoxynatronum buryatiense]
MKTTIRLTTAQALVTFLQNQMIHVDGEVTPFVHGFMGIFGHGNVVGLGQALEQMKDQMPFIQGKNEQDIAHACMAYAKQKRRRAIYACTASIGPGSLNLVTAAGTATVNRIPLLLLPGDTFADRQPDPVLQQVEVESDYTISANDAFKPVSRYWDRITRPEQLMSACLNALRVLTDPEKTGAVTLCLPQDVQGEMYDYPVDFLARRIWYLDRTPPAKEAVQRAAELIAGKKKPLIISGGGVRYSAAGEAVKALSLRFGIPVTETQAGKGEIQGDHPFYVGCAGICGTLAANQLMKEADIIIAIGTKLNDFVTHSKGGFQHNGIPLVSINLSRMDALKMGALSLVADAREGVTALTEALTEKQYTTGYQNEVEDAQIQWHEELQRLSALDPVEGLSQTRVLMELNQWLRASDIVVAASGSLPSDLERIWSVRQAGTYHLEYGFSCMGYEIAGAFGVKLAEPQAEVYSFVGDGAFLLAHSNLITSLQERQKINILLFNNHGHQCIRQLQNNQGIDTYGTEFRYREADTGNLSGSPIPIDFAKVAEGYGAQAYHVRSLPELKNALEMSRKSPVSTLIAIDVLPGTMTDGYANFWRVGTPSVSENPAVKEAHQRMATAVRELRKF